MDNDWRVLLAEAGIPVSAEAQDQMERHVDLVTRANRVCSLVSEGDLDRLWDRHVVDAVSLAPVIRRLGLESAGLLDIGSGGGFPALPLKVLLPGLKVVLLERSEKKAGFLRRVVAALGLESVEIVVGVFPEAARDMAAELVTARAVEDAAKVELAMAEYLRPGQVYLCQSGKWAQLREAGFHVERVDDAWSKAGFRRGHLHLVRRPVA